VGLKLVSILRREIDIQFLEVEAPQLRIIVHRDGTTNLPRPGVPRRGPVTSVERFLALAIDRVDVFGGTAEYGIEKVGIDLHGEQLRAPMPTTSSPVTASRQKPKATR